tara:strand:- start:281 stop:430 length:150 start_codon:yes stop_codon:yes gene_type:complete
MAIFTNACIIHCKIYAIIILPGRDAQAGGKGEREEGLWGFANFNITNFN